MDAELPCPGCGGAAQHTTDPEDDHRVISCSACHWCAEGDHEPRTLGELVALESYRCRDVDLAVWTRWVVAALESAL